jgi:TM2 domain-containing membrane protein YozV
MEDVSPKSRLATTLLAWFLGTLGVHRFYLGKTGTAIIMLILGIVGWITIWLWGLGFIFITAVGIWALIDFIFAVAGIMKDKEGKLIKNW